jgi:hypothetical protein
MLAVEQAELRKMPAACCVTSYRKNHYLWDAYAVCRMSLRGAELRGIKPDFRIKNRPVDNFWRFMREAQQSAGY